MQHSSLSIVPMLLALLAAASPASAQTITAEGPVVYGHHHFNTTDMAAQKRSSNRNYIELVQDGGDERHVAELAPASIRSIKDYLLGLVAARRSARNEAT